MVRIPERVHRLLRVIRYKCRFKSTFFFPPDPDFSDCLLIPDLSVVHKNKHFIMIFICCTDMNIHAAFHCSVFFVNTQIHSDNLLRLGNSKSPAVFSVLAEKYYQRGRYRTHGKISMCPVRFHCPVISAVRMPFSRDVADWKTPLTGNYRIICSLRNLIQGYGINLPPIR